MDKIPFEDGKKLKNATVTIQEQEYEVIPAQYQGTTPVSAFNLNKMQDNIDKSKLEKEVEYDSVDLNDINNTEIGAFNIYCTNIPWTEPKGGVIETFKVSENTALQRATNLSNGNIYQRLKAGGKWQPWIAQKINITTGDEFKTGRIIDGKEEYCKRCPFGSLPNSTIKGVQFLDPNDKILKAEGIAVSQTETSHYFAIPNSKIQIDIENGWINITTETNMSTYNAFVDLYYTKT